MNEDVKRVLALEDKLFDMTLKVHLMSKHPAYLYECDERECVEVRTLLGDNVFMLRYGNCLGLPVGAVAPSGSE